MKISWIVSDQVNLDPTIDLSRLKDVGSIWGSVRTWRAYQTDNVVCNNQEQAQKLIEGKFNQRCNFYIPKQVFEKLGSPAQVRAYGGEFEYQTSRIEEVISMHLASADSDIILLLGFDFNSDTDVHFSKLVEACIKNNENTQWVLVDYTVPNFLQGLNNVAADSLASIFEQLAG